ncbi:MAG: two-component sensor histidine kinase, partial [Clostridiaceae bacterium]|nr:two-component sensor histidine kinase [Clostridiaceae bacterium]
MKRLKTWLEHRTFSLKVLLVICFLIMTMIPLLVQAEFMASYFRQSQIERAMMEAQNKCVMLTNKMKSSDYITNTNNNVANPALDAELNVTANLSNGRIVVIDGSFRIIRDTFDVGRGKTVLVEDV